MDITRKRKIKRKVEISSVLLALILIYTIGVSIFLAVLGVARLEYEKRYISQIAVSLTGDVMVYSQKEGETYLVNSQNSAALGLLSTTGAIFFKVPFQDVTGRHFELVSVMGEEERAYLKYEETEDGKCRITIDCNGKTRVVSLRDIKYSTLARLVGAHSANGDNTPVDSLP